MTVDETSPPEPAADVRPAAYDVAVIGGGQAAFIAARVAAGVRA